MQKKGGDGKKTLLQNAGFKESNLRSAGTEDRTVSDRDSLVILTSLKTIKVTRRI